MRVISGRWRGRPLLAPPGLATRPTSDRAREALFSMLASRIGSFEGLKVADLFAGTGALGLEALSRGAAHCTFIEKDRKALDTLGRNLDRLGARELADLRAEAVEHARPPAEPCDLVFMDAPYASGLTAAALARIAERGWLAPGAWISAETAGETLEAPETFALGAERRIGKATIRLFRNRSASEEAE
jgi:16S rRNA (guanine966-N2)-methyltransferase